MSRVSDKSTIFFFPFYFIQRLETEGWKRKDIIIARYSNERGSNFNDQMLGFVYHICSFRSTLFLRRSTLLPQLGFSFVARSNAENNENIWTLV